MSVRRKSSFKHHKKVKTRKERNENTRRKAVRIKDTTHSESLIEFLERNENTKQKLMKPRNRSESLNEFLERNEFKKD